MMVHSYDRSFPHSLLSTSKLMSIMGIVESHRCCRCFLLNKSPILRVSGWLIRKLPFGIIKGSFVEKLQVTDGFILASLEIIKSSWHLALEIIESSWHLAPEIITSSWHLALEIIKSSWHLALEIIESRWHVPELRGAE